MERLNADISLGHNGPRAVKTAEEDTGTEVLPRCAVGMEMRVKVGTFVFEAVDTNMMTYMIPVMHAVTTEATFTSKATTFVTTIIITDTVFAHRNLAEDAVKYVSECKVYLYTYCEFALFLIVFLYFHRIEH